MLCHHVEVYPSVKRMFPTSLQNKALTVLMYLHNATTDITMDDIFIFLISGFLA
jgi:hypothetical protein